MYEITFYTFLPSAWNIILLKFATKLGEKVQVNLIVWTPLYVISNKIVQVTARWHTRSSRCDIVKITTTFLEGIAFDVLGKVPVSAWIQDQKLPQKATWLVGLSTQMKPWSKYQIFFSYSLFWVNPYPGKSSQSLSGWKIY